MDPISNQKKEQPNLLVQESPNLLQEQPSVPESEPVVEVVEKTEEEETLPDGRQESGSQEDEKVVDQPDKIIEEPITPPPPVSIPVPVPKPVKDRLSQEIEEILQEDLKEMYLAMPKENQQLFRQKGEETLVLVRQLVSEVHVNIKKIFVLIRTWLKMIPGVNRFFLEQEAKIKTDKILFVSEEEKRRGL